MMKPILARSKEGRHASRQRLGTTDQARSTEKVKTLITANNDVSPFRGNSVTPQAVSKVT
jgi:hypothetical protein